MQQQNETKSFKSLILFNFMANNLDPVTNVVFSGPGECFSSPLLFPSSCTLLENMTSVKVAGQALIVQHIVHLLFTALPVVEEEFFACRGSVRRTSTNKTPNRPDRHSVPMTRREPREKQ